MTETEYKQELLRAAKLRSRAAHQRDQANAYRRAMKTARDDDQRAHQQHQAEKVGAMANQNIAEADLIEADAKATTMIDVSEVQGKYAVVTHMSNRNDYIIDEHDSLSAAMQCAQRLSLSDCQIVRLSVSEHQSE